MVCPVGLGHDVGLLAGWKQCCIERLTNNYVLLFGVPHYRADGALLSFASGENHKVIGEPGLYLQTVTGLSPRTPCACLAANVAHNIRVDQKTVLHY